MYSKGNNQQSEETIYKWEKKSANHTCDNGLISKIYPKIQWEKPNNLNKNWTKNWTKTEQKLLKKRHTSGQMLHGKGLHIANHQKNANQFYNEISPHNF